MKKFFESLILILIIVGIYLYHNQIVSFIMMNIVYRDELLVKDSNEYKEENDWLYVKETDNFYPENKQDILNIFYTALNGGWDEVTFYCTDKYSSCLDDVKEMTSEDYILSNINNFVHVYNSYNHIYIKINNFGRVNIKIEKLYSDDQINDINNKIDEIYNSIITDGMSDYDKIKAVHDYIINNTIYDSDRANEIKSGLATDLKHKSNIAYGPLLEGKAICGGYTDAMALFLDKMGIENYKISSENHIWNLVYIDNEWKHLDLTWDDPVTSTGTNILTHTFFLVTTENLQSIDTTQHQFDKNIYMEAN